MMCVENGRLVVVVVVTVVVVVVVAEVGVWVFSRAKASGVEGKKD